MKKSIGISILSTMLILGQPFMALAGTSADTSAATSTTTPAGTSASAPADTSAKTGDTKVLNFADIESLVKQQNLNVQMNENDKRKTEAGYTGLTKTINDLEDDLDDVNGMRAQFGDSIASQLSGSKNSLLSSLKQSKYAAEDKPIYEAISDLDASMNNDIQTYTAENLFIGYNQSKLQQASTSLDLDLTQDQIAAMLLQENLGMVTSSSINDLRTKSVSDQTTLQSAKFQQDSVSRQLKNLLNEQESDLEIGSLPIDADNGFTVADKDADLKTALENSYSLKMQQEQLILLQNTVDRTKKDNGMRSKQYKQANIDLENAKLALTQAQDTLKANYYAMVDNIASIQSNLRLAQQSLADKKVKLSEAQLKMSLGLISKLDLDQIMSAYQVQDNTVKAAQIQLFTAIRGYSWVLRGMPSSSSSAS